MAATAEIVDQVGMIEIVGGIVAHADLLHHAARVILSSIIRDEDFPF